MSASPRPSWSLLAIASLLLAATAHAQTVYTWKDAKGVTHYSDAPPPKQAGTASVRTVAVSAPPAATPATPVAASTQAPASARTANEAAALARCTQARANLAALQGTAPVGPDTDGDGKPDSTMGADERAKQAAAMQAAIQRDCTGA